MTSALASIHKSQPQEKINSSLPFSGKLLTRSPSLTVHQSNAAPQQEGGMVEPSQHSHIQQLAATFCCSH